MHIGTHTLKVHLLNRNLTFNHTPKVSSMYQEGLSVDLKFENLFFFGSHSISYSSTNLKLSNFSGVYFVDLKTT